MIAAISEDPMSFKVCLSLICYVYLLFKYELVIRINVN